MSKVVTVDAGSQQLGTELSVDILRDIPRSLAAPGQAASVEQENLSIHGILDGIVEGVVISSVSAQAGSQAVSAPDIFAAAAAAGISLVGIDQSNLALVSSFALSDQAKAQDY